MASETQDSNDYSTETMESDQPSNLDEFREMVDALNLDVSNEATNNGGNFVEEQAIDQALVRSLEDRKDCEQLNSHNNTNTSVSVAELPTGIRDIFNVAAKQLSLFRGSVVDGTTNEHDEDFTEQIVDAENETASSSVELCSESVPAQLEESSSSVPKIATSIISSNTQQQKRHIMISYNHSSRETCLKIYESLVKKNYKVWMDLTDMGNDILASMAQAVENSYIVLLCINQKYYESEYCRLEAEYAAENRIKFIPCLMEASFRAQSWLGIIKGSNLHIDFSTPQDFDQSFAQLIRQITYVENILSLQPRCTPVPSSIINPMQSIVESTATMTTTHNINSRRFDAIIREYKKSIKTKRSQLNRLNQSELSDLIVKIRQELFTEASQVLTDSDRSDEEDDKQHNYIPVLEQLLNRSLDQNEILLRLVDRLTTPQRPEHTTIHNLDLNGIVKVILAIMLLWALNLICHNQE